MCLHLVTALCTVDNTSRVGAVASGPGISSVHCGQGGVAVPGYGDGGGGGGVTVAVATVGASMAFVATV